MVQLGLDSFLFVSLDDQIARISRMKVSIFFVIRARSEGCVRLPAFQHRRRHDISRPPGFAHSNGHKPEPACRSVRERES